MLKWGLSGRGSNLLKSDRRRHLTKRSSLHNAQMTKKCLRSAAPRADAKVAKVGPLRARVKSAKVRPTPYVYFPRVLKAYKGPKGRYTVGLAPLVARGALPLAGYIQLPRLIKCVLLVKKRKVCIHNNRGFLCVHTTPTRTAAHASRQGVTGPAGGARGLFQKNVPEVALPLSC